MMKAEIKRLDNKINNNKPQTHFLKRPTDRHLANLIKKRCRTQTILMTKKEHESNRDFSKLKQTIM